MVSSGSRRQLLFFVVALLLPSAMMLGFGIVGEGIASDVTGTGACVEVIAVSGPEGAGAGTIPPPSTSLLIEKMKTKSVIDRTWTPTRCATRPRWPTSSSPAAPTWTSPC